VIAAGQAFWLDIPDEPTDHLWIVVTEPDPQLVIVMVTDMRNVASPDIVIPNDTVLTKRFTLKKSSTVTFARSRQLESTLLAQLISGGRAMDAGICDPKWLVDIRQALLTSPDTPAGIKQHCASLTW